MKTGPIVIVAAICIACGCSGLFKRPTPSAEEYTQRYLGMIPTNSILDLQYIYHGAVGGYWTVARVTVNNLKELSLILSPTSIEDYSPSNDSDNLKRQVAESEFRMVDGEEVPSWFDLPFEKDMPIYVWEANTTPDSQGYSARMYLDEDKNVIYLIRLGD